MFGRNPTKTSPLLRLLLAGGSPITPWSPEDLREFGDVDAIDGFKTVVENGERTDYVYRDGEWEELGEDSEKKTESESAESDESSVNVAMFGDSESGRAVIDLSSKVEDGTVINNASLNNGILEVEFEQQIE